LKKADKDGKDRNEQTTSNKLANDNSKQKKDSQDSPKKSPKPIAEKHLLEEKLNEQYNETKKDLEKPKEPCEGSTIADNNIRNGMADETK